MTPSAALIKRRPALSRPGRWPGADRRRRLELRERALRDACRQAGEQFARACKAVQADWADRPSAPAQKPTPPPDNRAALDVLLTKVGTLVDLIVLLALAALVHELLA